MNRRVQIIFCFFVLFSQYGKAQPTFNKVFDYKKHLDFALNILKDDSIYLTLTSAEGFFSGDVGMLLSAFTPTGKLKWNKFFSKKGNTYYTCYPGTFFKTKDGGYAFGGTLETNDGSQHSQAILVKYNHTGDTQWIKKFSYSGYDGAYQALQTYDGGYVVFGTSFLNGIHSQYYLIRTDSNGNLLWQKIYGGLYQALGLSFAIKPNGHFLLLGGQQHVTCYLPWFIETDDTGGVYKSTLLTSAFFECAAGPFRPTIDGGYIIWGATDSVIETGNYQYPRYFAKLDSNLNVQWKTIYSETTIEDFYTIRQFPDSSYVSVGFHADPFYGSAFGWIAKTDKNGNKLWQHDYYKRQDYDNYMADVQQTSDKGYIITGTAWDSMQYPSQDIWLIRLDSNGCLIPGCDSAVTDVIEVGASKNELIVFPNPATNQLQIEYNIPLSDHAGKLAVYDVWGRLIQSKTIQAFQHESILDVSGYASGTYLLQLITSHANVTKKFIKP